VERWDYDMHGGGTHGELIGKRGKTEKKKSKKKMMMKKKKEKKRRRRKKRKRWRRVIRLGGQFAACIHQLQFAVLIYLLKEKQGASWIRI